jgi:hypothetical protein
MPRESSFWRLLACWLILFPLGCGFAVLSFGVVKTMSGRILKVEFNPLIFGFSMILFLLTSWATYSYVKESSALKERRLRVKKRVAETPVS